ncbi:hypothetical protein K1T71_005031 [Dendrolimus kikuchii]|uniref:Uncharacterized protein n=1 Tax=Dendrolimus kikuchii TaxID=765133 RepID=A0ACC1D6G6_9NEOP|nr:hypothetical protein K1T71_005031 [Dendrolimus kikuchii]
MQVVYAGRLGIKIASSCDRRSIVVRTISYFEMDAKIVMCLLVMVMSVCVTQTQAGVVFNFHEKLQMSSQVIRVPDLACPLGERRDSLGHCRKRF